jgi:type II secretion system protein G
MQKLMKRLHKNQKGFTLVELMVVVVIIGILVAIAVPIYNTIQTTAKENAHQANIRTIQGMIELYKADNNGENPATEDNLSPEYILEWPTEPGTYSVENGVLTSTDPE